jgi:hypothetical protein
LATSHGINPWINPESSHVGRPFSHAAPTTFGAASPQALDGYSVSVLPKGFPSANTDRFRQVTAQVVVIGVRMLRLLLKHQIQQNVTIGGEHSQPSTCEGNPATLKIKVYLLVF